MNADPGPSRPDPLAAVPVAPLRAAEGVERILDRIDRIADRGELSLRDVVAAFGDRSFVPVMMVPAILVVSPLSGIPVFSSICGISIALVALQMVFGRDHLWLPERLMRQSVAGRRVHMALGRMRGLARWLDQKARDRFRPLVDGPLSKLPQILAALAGLAMPFLELVPFSSSLLGVAVLLFSAGLLARDGLFAIAGMGIVVVAATVPFAVYGVF